MRNCSRSRMPLLNHMTEHHLYVCVKISVYPIYTYTYTYIWMLFENWSYFARDDIVCLNKLSFFFSIHASESPKSYIYIFFLLDWHSLVVRSIISFSSLLSLRWSIFWEERECNSPNHHSSMCVYMNKVKWHGEKVRNLKANDDHNHLIDKKSQMEHEKTWG